MKLTVHFVTWNSAQYVPRLFESLRGQTYTDWKLFVWDNNSSDGIVDAIKKEVQDFPVPFEIMEHADNVGFSGGHNSLYKKTDSEYFLLLNPDLYLQPDCFEKLVAFLDKNKDVAAVSPRLMKWHFEKLEEGLEKSFSSTIDSLGLQAFRSGRVIEQYTGCDWAEVASTLSGEENILEVFGLAGTFPLLRRKSIDEIVFSDGTFLDESYGSYKEDVDLAFRMQSAGQRNMVLLDTVAYHARATGGPKGMSDIDALKNKR